MRYIQFYMGAATPWFISVKYIQEAALHGQLTACASRRDRWFDKLV